MKKYTIALIIGLSISLIGCAYKQGTPVTQTQEAQFHAGKTTKTQILAALGTPQELKNDGADQWMVYNYTEISAIGSNTNDSTTFVIDSDGILKQILKGKSNSSNPLLQ